jgi:hypothetical protein
MMLEIALHKDPSDPAGAPALLTLPASRYELLVACAQIHVDDLNEAFVELGGIRELPHVTSCLRTVSAEPDFVDKLNVFAHRLQEMEPYDRVLLDGFCYIAGPDNMRDMFNMTYSLNGLVCAGGIENAEQLGGFLVGNGFVDFPEEAVPWLDFEKIGQTRLAEHTCGIVNGVYYEQMGDLHEVYDGVTLPELPDYDRDMTPELSQEELFAPQMGGM